MPPDKSELNDRLISFACFSFLFHFHSLMGELRMGLFGVGISDVLREQREYMCILGHSPRPDFGCMRKCMPLESVAHIITRIYRG